MYKNYFAHVVVITVLLFSNLLVANISDRNDVNDILKVKKTVHSNAISNVLTEISGDNNPDPDTNLALIDDATLSGSASNGRGPLKAILYNPASDDYFIKTGWNEYGVAFDENLGQPDADNGFFWRVDWSVPKSINYVTFGGSYPNQPQPNAMWKVSYLNNNIWITIEEGQGGWIDDGIFEWDGTDNLPIVADALRVQIYSDGSSDLVSVLVRGRGGISNNIDDSATETKATLIQYLGDLPELSVSEVEGQTINKMQIFPNPSSGDVYINFTRFVGIKDVEIYDISGRLVKFLKGDHLTTEDQRISIQGLSDGVYNLNVIDVSGFRHQEKLIVRR